MDMTPKQGQVEVTFNWVYVLIAGAVILLFFIGLVVRQKAVSEEQLSIEVVRIMESIFTGAGVSEKTKNFIDISGLAEYTLYFGCSNEVGEYGILGTSARAENAIDPFFAPKEIKASQLIVWSLPYRLPFKVIDFLFITSSNTQYIVLGEVPFATEFVNSTQGFNVQHLVSRQEYEQIDPGHNFQVRIIDTVGTTLTAGSGVPLLLQSLGNERVTGVSFGQGAVTYYSKNNENKWEQQGAAVPMVSLDEERDAAKYAAIFAADADMYQCNLKKAFRRLELINEVYGGKENEPGGKIQQLLNYYGGHPESLCKNPLVERQDNLVTALASHQRNAAACRLDASTCTNLIASARALRTANKALAELGDCITLY